MIITEVMLRFFFGEEPAAEDGVGGGVDGWKSCFFESTGVVVEMGGGDLKIKMTIN